jgi:hypothetical protein
MLFRQRAKAKQDIMYAPVERKVEDVEANARLHELPEYTERKPSELHG